MKSFVAIASFAAVAVATTPTTAESCAMHCNLAMDGCVATGSPISVCTDVYIECLGYNPYDEVPFTKPTKCHLVGSPEFCADRCNSSMDGCVAAGKAIKDCTETYVKCLGYNPYDETPFTKPKACRASHVRRDACADRCNTAMDKCVAGGNAIKGCTETYEKCLGYNPYDEVPFKKPTTCRKEHLPRDACARRCNSAMDKCVAGGNAIKDCTETYEKCLGYNPYDEVPFKKPTSCRK